MPIICENSYLLNLRKNEMFSATLKKKKVQRKQPWFVFPQPCAGVWPAGFQLRVSDGVRKQASLGSKRNLRRNSCLFLYFVFVSCFVDENSELTV